MNKRIGSLSCKDIQAIHHQAAIHESDGDIIWQFGIIAILDVLAWKRRLCPNSITAYFNLVNDLRLQIYDTFKRCAEENDDSPKFNVVTLSDTVVILINSDSQYCEFNIFQHVSEFLARALERGFMFRGAISRGQYYTNPLRNAFVGNAYYEAAAYAEKTEWAGVIITDTLSSALLKNNTIEDLAQIGIIQYNNIPFKKDIAPCKDRLVLVPQNQKKISLSSQSEIRLDYKGLYKEYMKEEPEKCKNTIAFIEHLEKNVWAKSSR